MWAVLDATVVARSSVQAVLATRLDIVLLVAPLEHLRVGTVTTLAVVCAFLAEGATVAFRGECGEELVAPEAHEQVAGCARVADKSVDLRDQIGHLGLQVAHVHDGPQIPRTTQLIPFIEIHPQAALRLFSAAARALRLARVPDPLERRA